MATVEGWEKGGIFTWVERTLGSIWGLAAVFYQWFQITVGFVTMIYFIVGALSYVLGWSSLNDNVIIKLIATLVIFWIITFTQFFGTKLTSYVAKIGFFVGILGTGLVLFVLGIVYISNGNILQISFNSGWIPDFSNINTLAIFVSFILAYAGVEGSASHANEMKNPGRDYPIAILLLVIVAIVLNTLGGIIVASTIPQNELGLNTGVIQAYKFLVTHYYSGGEWIVRILALLICLGVIVEVACWVVGPSTSFLYAANKGLLPKALAQTNKHKVPVRIVLVQALVMTIWIFILTLGGGGGNLSFFIAMALTVCIYLVAYCLMFISYVVLAVSYSKYKRAFAIPIKFLKILVALIGLIVSILAFIVSFFVPSNIEDGTTYLTILIVCWVVMVIIPFIIYGFYGRKHYIEDNKKLDNNSIVNVNNNIKENQSDTVQDNKVISIENYGTIEIKLL